MLHLVVYSMPSFEAFFIHSKKKKGGDKYVAESVDM